MKKEQVIQKFIDRTKAKTYLEIGVKEGNSIRTIKCKKRIGVDPNMIYLKPDFTFKKIFFLKFIFSQKFIFDLKKFFYKIFKGLYLYERTSDEFFLKNIIKNKKIDVAFIDGLHQYEQVIRDVDNCLKCLNKKGVIILHDCNPVNKVFAIRAGSLKEAEKIALKKNWRWTEEWNGDVWKAIVYLRSYRKDLKIYTLDTDYGLGVIKRGIPENTLNYNKNQIKEMDYEYLNKNRKKLLNLKKIK